MHQSFLFCLQGDTAMAEFLALGGFLAGLTICVAAGWEVLYALLFGMVCFAVYAYSKGSSAANVVRMLGEGMYRVVNILEVFVLIGCMTALWRISGTIPFILYHSVGVIQPQFFVLCTFLLCCMMSFLTGTSFGTVSTMGVICMMISNTAGLNPLLTAGAILSGIFFGDRCSPMSSSAALVCSLTKTDIYGNVRNMMRSGLVPFILTCLLYVVLASGAEQIQPDTAVTALFEEYFVLHWITVLPALLILLLALFHVNVKVAMGVSILTAVVIATALQGMKLEAVVNTMWNGCRYEQESTIAELLNGGGIRSMVRVGLIVTVSASYSGIFAHTPLISGIRKRVQHSAALLRPFGTVLLTGAIACMVSCNQSLATILTCQICDGVYERKEDLALAVEDTVIVIAALVPWSIAGAVPVMTIGSDSRCLLYAFYLFLVPLWNLTKSFLPEIFRTNKVRIS